MSEVNILVNTVKEDFDNFLELEGNSRIFFSGRFGIGKTYFLNSFFDINSEKYEVFHLYPVNYQINSNEDILNLIKYDILIELLNKDSEILQSNTVEGVKDNALLLYSWAKENVSLNNILQSTLSAGKSALSLSGDPVSSIIGKLGRPLVELLKFDQNYQVFKKDYKKGEKGIAEKFIHEIESKKIHESDYFSDLLKRKVVLKKGS